LHTASQAGDIWGIFPPEYFNTLHSNFETITLSYWLIISLKDISWTGNLIANFVYEWYLTTNMLKLGNRLKCWCLTVAGVSQPSSNVARETRNSQEPQSY